MLYMLIGSGVSAITLAIIYTKLFEVSISYTSERKVVAHDGKIRIERTKPPFSYWLFYLGRLFFLGLCVYTLLCFAIINLVFFLGIFLLFFIGRSLARFLMVR